MNITRYTWPVIIAAGLHGALLLCFNGDPVVIEHTDVEKPKWNPPPKPPVELILEEPEVNATGEKSGGAVTPLPASTPEVMRPLPDNTTFITVITERLTPIAPVDHLKDYRGEIEGNGVGPGEFVPNHIPKAIDLDRAPRAIVQPSPDYPDSFRRDSINGSVTVEFLVDTTGRVISAEAVRWSRREFVDPAVRAVLRWRFEPGTVSGRKVRFRMAVPIEFNAAG